jgi:hypothetical protein
VRPAGRLFLLLFTASLALASSPTHAGNQQEELLAASVRAALHSAVSDAPPTVPIQDAHWLDEMSHRLEKRIPDPNLRRELLATIHYEATRAGLDPQLVLGLIQVESRFKKYALSKAGARGYMQVMPFWVKTIGNREDNLFHMRTNLRYGCTILRHYINLEKGNLYLALGRYNGSRGKAAYPNLVHAAWQKWNWNPQQNPTQLAAEPQLPVRQASVPAAVVAPPQVVSPPPRVAVVSPPQAVPQQPAAVASVQVAPPPAPVAVTPPPAPARTTPRAPVRRDIVIVR